MNPILFHLGPVPVYSFGLLVATGVLISIWLMSRKAKRTGFPPGDMATDMVFVTVASGFLGARLYYVIQNASWYLESPVRILMLWEGGLIFYGGQIGAFLGVLIFFKIKKIAPSKGFDFILPYVALAHAFGRIGCFLNGCCHGKACDLPWAVQFKDLPAPVHPTQLYEAALNLLLFLFLIRKGDKQPVSFPGQITALYFAGYAAIRFFIEFFRADNPMVGFFTINQWLSLAIFAAALVFYFKRYQVPQRS